MITIDRCTTTVIFLLAAALTWLGYHLGSDNLMVILTVGGGVGFAMFASAQQDNSMMFCLLLTIAGLLFTLFGAGILAALSLFVAAVLSAFFMGILVNG